MSSLQIALAVLGGLILAAVIAYDTWRTRKNLPRQADETPEPQLDDPAWNPQTEGAGAPRDGQADGRIEPVLDAGGRATQTLNAQHHHVLDPLIDVVIPMSLEGQVVTAEAILAAMPSTRRVGTKPFFIEALYEDDANSQWELPMAGRRYHALQAGVQMANRQGAINEIEFSEFVMKVQRLADALNASPDLPDMRHEIERARELDQFASEHDAQLSLTLRARKASWSPAFVLQHAEKLGFVEGHIPGRMIWSDEDNVDDGIITLIFDSRIAMSEDWLNAALREFNLQLDVPQVARQKKAFEHLCELAFVLAENMDGLVTDGGAQAVRQESLQVIARDLQFLYDALEQRDLAAGSPQARRLFS